MLMNFVFSRSMKSKSLHTALADRFFTPTGTNRAYLRDISSRFSTSEALAWKNVEYASSLPPLSQNTGCLGRLDYLVNADDGSVVVRGWIFHHQRNIRSLALSNTRISVRVSLYGLLRQDVAAVFPLYQQARQSGFMGYFPAPTVNVHSPTSRPMVTNLDFHCELDDGRTASGSLIRFPDNQ